MLDNLTTETRNPASKTMDEMSALELAQLLNREDAKVIEAVGSQSEPIGAAIDAIADRFRSGGRLVYMGAGTSGRLGVLDAAECPPTFSTDPAMVVGLIAGGEGAMFQAVESAEDHPEFGVADLKSIHFSEKDALVGIAASGRTPYVIGGLEYAQSLGAIAIGVACNAGNLMSPHSDIMICPVVGPEVLTGSTRMKAGTACKIVLNMLSTGAMVRIGKSYGNLMVDLSATNSKLMDRSARLVRWFTGLEQEPAQQLLDECDGKLKNAIVAHCCQVSPAEAIERLESAGGHLRAALKDAPCPPKV
jgi:N-acetylmuramic acid 6-phosphate etherase